MSKQFRGLKLTWLKRGDPLPRKTRTSRFNGDPGRILGADRDEGSGRLDDWFHDGPDVGVFEEIVGLGSYSKTLTVLTVDDDSPTRRKLRKRKGSSAAGPPPFPLEAPLSMRLPIPEHEVGHTVVALSLGIEIVSVSCFPGRTECGAEFTRSIPQSDVPPAAARCAALFCLGGLSMKICWLSFTITAGQSLRAARGLPRPAPTAHVTIYTRPTVSQMHLEVHRPRAI